MNLINSQEYGNMNASHKLCWNYQYKIQKITKYVQKKIPKFLLTFELIALISKS